MILPRLWRGGRKGIKNIKGRGYTPRTNNREGINEFDHIL